MSEALLPSPPSVAICCIIKNEGMYVREWVEYHSAAGAGTILVYDNLSEDETSQEIQNISPFCNVFRIPWKNGLTWIHTQRSAYMDAIRRLRSDDFIAFIDVDEFLYSPNGRDLPEALSFFSADVAAVAVNQLVFGSSGLLTRSSKPVVQRFVYRTPSAHDECLWYKSIVRPDCVLYPETAHNFKLAHGTYVHADGTPLRPSPQHPGKAMATCMSHLLINHYMLKSKEEYSIKRQRWRGTSLQDRYTEAYFDARDVYANLVRDTTLASLYHKRGLRS